MESIVWQVYCSLGALFRARGYEQPSDYAPAPEQKPALLKTIAHTGFVACVASSPAPASSVQSSSLAASSGAPAKTRRLIVCVLDTAADYPAKVSEFKKFRSLLEQQFKLKTEAAPPIDCMLIGKQFSSAVAIEAAREEPKIRFSAHDYEVFQMPLFDCPYVPRQEIATGEDLAMLKAEYIDWRTLPKILAADPACVWLGAEPGQLIKIWRLSETAGITIAYRLVV